MSNRSSNWLTPCLVLCLAAAGVEAQAPPSPSTAEPASLSGTVTNSVTGVPVPRAHVTIRGTGEIQRIFGAMTNGEGKFTMTKAPPGHYSVTAEHLGFVTPSSQDSSLSDVTLGPGDKREDFKLALAPTGSISGRVLDAAGEPVEGVSVTAEGSRGNESDTTDDKGEFRIGGLHPGKYRLMASPQSTYLLPETRTDGTTDVHYAHTYYPDSLAEKQATRIDVQPAAELTGIDIHLVATPIVSIRGRVLGLPQGAKNVLVNVQPLRDDNWQSGATVKPDGTFALWRLDPGKYTLVTTMFGQGSPQNTLQSPPMEIEVGSVNVENIELRMIPAFDIPVQLRFEDEQAGQPMQAPAPPGRPQRPQPTRRLSLRRAGDSRMFNLPVDVGPDDSLTLEKVQPGLYRVVLSWGRVYVKSVRIGSTETEGDLLDVRNGLGGPVTVVVSANTCQVTGTVSDSNGPVANVRVALVHAMGGAQANPYIAIAAAGGTYTITGVAPGKYKILVVDDDALAAVQRGLGTEDYEDIAESLDLQAGDKITKDLTQRR